MLITALEGTDSGQAGENVLSVKDVNKKHNVFSKTCQVQAEFPLRSTLSLSKCYGSFPFDENVIEMVPFHAVNLVKTLRFKYYGSTFCIFHINGCELFRL